MTEGQCALYARVSSESQARDNTIASQIAALRERIAAENFQLEPDHSYVDEGYSGSILSRPALERLRDAVAGGHIERIYVHAPDRLARRYAHQVLLIDEFRRAGAEVVFLNRPIGGTAEDDLLLQVQGVIAEYERAKILERSRRGRRHAALSGSVSALTGAPFGYRYVSRSEGGGVARFEVVEDEARIVRLIFAWIGLDRMSLREVCRRLQQMGCQTRRGSTFWYASTIRSMLDNPAYVGRATFGRPHFLPPRPRLRPIRGHLQPSPRATSRVPVPREEWIEIPVSPLVDPTVFDVVRTQLEENRRRKRHQKLGKCWLLQGLTVCRNCGYAYYGKTAPRSRKYDPTNILRYYRCTGADGYRFNGKAMCNNGPVRSDQLEQIVWDQVRALVEDPHRVADEYRGRMARARDGAAMPDEILRLDRQIATLRRGIGRLIDSYAENVIDKAEFEPRITGLKQRMSQLQERHQEARDAAEVERNLSLVISRLEDFSAKVTNGLDRLDRSGMRDVIRILVRRIEIDDGLIEVVFRVPSPEGSRSSPTEESGSWQHCTGVGRTNVRMAWAVQASRQRLGESQSKGARLLAPRFNQTHAEKTMQSSMISPDRLLGITELADGLDFVPVAMGIFGLSEIIANLRRGDDEDRTVVSQKISRLWPTADDFKRAWPATIRGTAIGSILGVLPGGGALLSSFAAYTVEKRVSRTPERFGKGAIEGVAGPESANNAGAQTSFIPMLTLGIPSNVVMAMMIGAMTIQGITPGPTVMTERPQLFWGMIVSMWVGNLMLVVINLPLIGMWVKLLSVPYRILFPIIIVICGIGVYSVHNSTADVVITAALGLLGYVMIRLGCEPAPMALGFVLGPLMEENLRRSMLLSRGDPLVFLTRPISAALLAMSLFLLLTLLLPTLRKQREVAFQE